MANKKLYFFTDLRSAKITLLQQSPMASLLFYHPEHKFQMVLYGSVTLHHQNAMTKAYWQKLPVWGRRTYATTSAPGTFLEKEGSGLPDFWRDDMALAESEYAYAHFAVLVFQTSHWEALSLHREGNQRIQFHEPQGRGEWLVP
jgi:pyridoxine/pyridoxamine 5'-phosphate oxidase